MKNSYSKNKISAAPRQLPLTDVLPTFVQGEPVMNEHLGRIWTFVKKHCPLVARPYVKSLARPILRAYSMLQLFLHKRRYREELDVILAEHAKIEGIIIHPANLDWFYPLFQRPQQLARVFSRRGYLFFFCAPWSYQRGFIRVEKHLYACGKNVLPLLKTIPDTIFLVNPNTQAKRDVEKARYATLLYDVIDDITFWGREIGMHEAHRFLLQRATLVLCTADRLFQQAKKEVRRVLLVPNAADYEFFHCPALRDPTEHLPDINAIARKNQPIIGYYGALGEWFDLELMEYVLSVRPKYNFVLIGHNYDGSMTSYLNKKRRNLFFLGWKPYNKLPVYLSYFNVAMIPFKINEITKATSPVKMFEYMAGGKPVVTTAMKECMKYQSVLIGKTKEEFVEQLDRALQLQKDPQYLSLLDKEAKENTWEQRVEQIIQALTTKLKTI